MEIVSEKYAGNRSQKSIFEKAEVKNNNFGHRIPFKIRKKYIDIPERKYIFFCVNQDKIKKIKRVIDCNFHLIHGPRLKRGSSKYFVLIVLNTP